MIMIAIIIMNLIMITSISHTDSGWDKYISWQVGTPSTTGYCQGDETANVSNNRTNTNLILW